MVPPRSLWWSTSARAVATALGTAPCQRATGSTCLDARRGQLGRGKAAGTPRPLNSMHTGQAVPVREFQFELLMWY